MERFKNILLKLLFPPTVIVILLVPVATALLIYTFAFENADSPVAYISYVLSAYALTVLCAKAPMLFSKAKSVKDNNKYINRYITDVHLRMQLSLYGTVIMNTLYALVQLFSGIYYHSVWFYALAGYYIILVLMRYFLLKETRQKKTEKDLFREYLLYRLCGVLLLLMNLTLGVIVTYIVLQNRGFERSEILTIAMAAYTFYSMTAAVINVIKYRKYESPVMSAAKAISLAAALVSMLSLETSMLSAFGGDTGPQFRRIMTASTGTAVCLSVLIMAVYMIVHSTKKINLIKKGVKKDE